MKEHSLQVAVAHMLQVVLDPLLTWWSSLDHAAQLSARYGAERKRRGVKRGLPDIIILTDGCLIGIELKVARGELTFEQADTMSKWNQLGHHIYVARSLEEVQEILDHCRIPLRTRMTIFPKLKVPPNVSRKRSSTARHSRSSRRRKSKNHLPLVLGVTPQEN